MLTYFCYKMTVLVRFLIVTKEIEQTKGKELVMGLPTHEVNLSGNGMAEVLSEQVQMFFWVWCGGEGEGRVTNIVCFMLFISGKSHSWFFHQGPSCPPLDAINTLFLVSSNDPSLILTAHTVLNVLHISTHPHRTVEELKHTEVTCLGSWIYIQTSLTLGSILTHHATLPV